MQQEIDTVDLLEYWRILKRGRWLIAALTSAALLVAVVVSLLLPQIYRATAVIMPLGGGGGLSLGALASQLPQISLDAGILGGNKGITTQLLALLGSRTLAERVVEHNDMLPHLFPERWDSATKNWKGNGGPTVEEGARRLQAKVSASENRKSGTLLINAEFTDPQLAVQVATSYVDLLQVYIRDNTFSLAKRNRLFIAGQLAKTKRELLEAGKSLNAFYQDSRVSSVDSKVNVPILLDDLDGAAMPGQLVVSQSLIEQQLEDSALVKDVPQQVYLQYLALRRDLLGKLTALLAQQYELTKIEEKRDELAFQILDPAVQPKFRIRPQRGGIVVFSTLGAGFLSVFVVFAVEHFRRARRGNSE